MDNATTEQWKPVYGWEDRYEVSDHGKVRSLNISILAANGVMQNRTGKLLAQHPSEKGYFRVKLFRGGKCTNYYTHLLVAEAFICPRPDGMEVCHNDGNSQNNHVSNLRWGTKSENRRDRIKHGTDHEKNKTHCPRSHPLVKWNLVKSAAKNGHRSCLACSRALAYSKKYKLMDLYEEISHQYFAEIQKQQLPA